MAYHILETPDHLHRALHLFAIDNLHTLLSFIEKTCRDWDGENSLASEDHWLLRTVLDTVRPRPKALRLLARKEAQDFFRMHPALRAAQLRWGLARTNRRL